MHNRLDCHVQSNDEWCEPGERTCRLWNDVNRIDHSVDDPWNGGNTEQIDGARHIWSRQNVRQTNSNERKNIFEIVAVCSIDFIF